MDLWIPASGDPEFSEDGLTPLLGDLSLFVEEPGGLANLESGLRRYHRSYLGPASLGFVTIFALGGCLFESGVELRSSPVPPDVPQPPPIVGRRRPAGR